MKSRTKNRGVTLLELMMALGVLAILIAVAVPSFRSFSGSSRATTANNNLVTALALARSEALRRGNFVSVCGAEDEAMDACSGAEDWSTGWIAFLDNNNDGVIDAGEDLLQVFVGPGAGLEVTAGLPSVAYNSMGMMVPNGETLVEFEIVPPECTGQRAIQATLNTAGTVRSARVACP